MNGFMGSGLGTPGSMPLDSLYNEGLAKDQIRAMFDFQLEDGFIVDCVLQRYNN